MAEGIALAVELGHFGETYLLAGEPHRRREFIQYWATRPGGFKVGFYIPSWLAWAMFALLEPLQRRVGLPAFISREAVITSVHLNYSSAKAQRELGWTHRSAQVMWHETVDGELELLAQRQKRDLLSRLKPMDLGCVLS